MSRNKPRRSDTVSSPVIDIVILTAGRFDMLAKCLDALRVEAENVPTNVILIDNGTDAEEKLANLHLFEPDNFPEFSLQTKRLTQNVGFPAGCNEGARMGKAPLIMFLNDDVELKDGALDKIVKQMDYLDIGVVGIKLIFPPDSTSPNRPAGKVQHVGMAFTVHGDPIHPLVGWSADNPKCCISRDVSMVTGSCLTTRRSLFTQLGQFDMIYGRGYFEDTDYCLKVKAKGLRIYMMADAYGYHYVGSTYEKRKESVPMQINSMTFKSRWANSGVMKWDEYIWY